MMFMGGVDPREMGNPEAAELRKELGKVTERLCAVLRKLEDTSRLDVINNIENGRLRTWWEKRKVEDAQSSVDSKITMEEIDLVWTWLEEHRQSEFEKAARKLRAKWKTEMAWARLDPQFKKMLRALKKLIEEEIELLLSGAIEIKFFRFK